MPGLQVQSMVGVMKEVGSRYFSLMLMFLFLSFTLPSPLSVKVNKFFLKNHFYFHIFITYIEIISILNFKKYITCIIHSKTL